MTVQILESAKSDLRDGRLFYESQGGRWLGSYFFDTLFSAIDSLAIYAGIHRRRYGFYWMLVSHFPYSVYYDATFRRWVKAVADEMLARGVGHFAPIFAIILGVGASGRP